MEEYLIGKGRDLRVWDPHIHLESIYGSNREYILNSIPHIGKLLTAEFEDLLRWGAQSLVLTQSDDDCEPSPDWLATLEESLAAHPDSLIGGRIVNGLSGNLCSAASQQLVDYLYASYTGNGAPCFFASNNFALSRRRFRDLGGFDESFPLPAAEDRDFCERWRQSGGSMVYMPVAIVHHTHALTVSGFVGHHFRYGRGAYRFWKGALSRGGQRPRLEPLSFYLDFLAYPFRSATCQGIGCLRISLLFVLSQIANAAGFLHQAFLTSSKGGK